MMPSFVVDLPGGGGKRLAASFDTYDRETGISTFKAPGMPGGKGHKVYKYYDPLRTDKTSGTGIGTYEHRHASLQAGRQ
jgi:lysine 2,3-aminomutase